MIFFDLFTEKEVKFDIDGDEVLELLGWTAAGDHDAFLILDLNDNGRADNGRELFGNATVLEDGSLADHGYQALVELDSNGDGQIDWHDEFYSLLGLWVDVNHNGISESDEVTSLSAKGIVSLNTDYKESKERDKHGNWFAFLSSAQACSDKHCTGIETIMTTDVFCWNKAGTGG